MLQARITRLDSGARRAVRAAAIFGQSFARGGLAALLGIAASSQEVASWLAALAAAELTQKQLDGRSVEEDVYGFRHALVRDAAYGLLSPEDRAIGHQLAGEFLQRLPGVEAAVIAEHFEQGGELPRAASYYWQAGERSLQQCDYRGALRQVERGSRCAPDEVLAAQLSSVRCAIDYRNGRFSPEHASRASSALKVLRPGSIAWSRAAAAAVATLMILQKPAAELFAQVLSTEPDASGRAAYIDSISYLTNWAALGAPRALTEALLRRLKEVVVAAAPDLPSVRYYLHGSAAQVALYRHGHPFTAITQGALSQRLAHEAGDTMAEFHMRCHILELGWLELGDQEGVVSRMRELRALVFASQELGLGTIWRQVFGRSLCESADEAAWDEAIEVTAPLLKVQNLSFFAHAIRARVALQRGQLQTAEELSRQAMKGFPMLPYYSVDLAVTRACALLALGRAAEAAAAASSTLAIVGADGSCGPFEVELRLAASEAYQAAGDTERARLELGAALRQMQVRLDDIGDPLWRTSYLTRNRHCARARKLGADWGLEV